MKTKALPKNPIENKSNTREELKRINEKPLNPYPLEQTEIQVRENPNRTLRRTSIQYV